jgi:hypothetical protein
MVWPNEPSYVVIKYAVDHAMPLAWLMQDLNCNKNYISVGNNLANTKLLITLGWPDELCNDSSQEDMSELRA